MGELAIPPAEFEPDDNEIHALWAVVSGRYEYANLDIEAAKWQTYLLVADSAGENWQAIGIAEGAASGQDGEGSYAVRGDITAASHWSSEDFSVPDGETKTVAVPLAVMLIVRDSGGNVLADAQVSQSADITVTPGGTVAKLGGEGTIQAQDDSGDPTPTLSGGG